MIRSRLDYCCQLWSPSQKGNNCMSQSLVLGYSRTKQSRSSLKYHMLKNKLPEKVLISLLK